MAYNIEFRCKKLTMTRMLLREFCLRGLPRAQVRSDILSAYDKYCMFVETWFKSYLTTVGHKDTTRHFLTLDTRDMEDNPLAVLLKSKYFCETQLIAHWEILNALSGNDYTSSTDIINQSQIDHKTIRAVLEDYTKLGLLEKKSDKNKFLYRLAKSTTDLSSCIDFLSFFSETDSMGLVGHCLKDRYRIKNGSFPKSHFRFRHHYIHHILDSDVLEIILTAIRQHSPVRIKLFHWLKSHQYKFIIPDNYFLVDKDDKLQLQENHQKPDDLWLAADVIPVKILTSVRTGRRYLMGFYLNSQQCAVIRIDHIDGAKPINVDNPVKLPDFESFAQNLWGVSIQNAPKTTHVEMEIMADHPQASILARLEAEKRCGSVQRISPYSARFSADVYNARELFPWLRTFTGYIRHISFSDEDLNRLFIQRLHSSLKMD